MRELAGINSRLSTTERTVINDCQTLHSTNEMFSQRRIQHRRRGYSPALTVMSESQRITSSLRRMHHYWSRISYSTSPIGGSRTILHPGKILVEASIAQLRQNVSQIGESNCFGLANIYSSIFRNKTF